MSLPSPLPGPTCHDARLDALARALALDVLLDPRGARALAAYWVANYTDRPRQALPGPAFASLIRRLALETRGRADLALVVHDRGDGRLSYVLRLHDGALNLAVTHEFLVRARRWRALLALADLVEVRPHQRLPAFTLGDLGGLRGELRLGGFAHNAMLDFFFVPAHYLVLTAAEFARVLAVKPALAGADPELLMAMTLHVADAFMGAASDVVVRDAADLATVDACKALSTLFRAHAVAPAALHAAVEAMAAAECERTRALHLRVCRAWGASADA